MKRTLLWIRLVFVLSGLYDMLAGIVFLFFAPAIYQRAGIPPPSHPAYVQLPSLVIMVFGAMFFQISKDPQANRNLIPFGLGFKASYCIVILLHAMAHKMPFLMLPFAWADIVCLVLFAAAYRATGTGRQATPESS